MDQYINRYIYSDFVIGENEYFNINNEFINQMILNQRSIKDLTSIQGVEEYGCIYFKELDYTVDRTLKDMYQEALKKTDLMEYQKNEIRKCLQKEAINSHLYGADEALYQYFDIYSGSFDATEFSSGHYILVSPIDFEGKVTTYVPGDMVELNASNGETKSYTVMAIASIPFNLGIRHSHLVTPEFILPSNEYIKLIEDNTPMILTMNVENDFIDSAEDNINDYCKNKNPYLNFESKTLYEEEFSNTKQVFVIVGTVLSIILGLIGIMNYTNTILTSIIVRKKELTLLQSIGMTSKQLKLMLILEGVIYIISTLALVLSIGVILGKFIISMASRVIWFMDDNFIVHPSLICLLILTFIAGLIPYICYNFISRDSIVQRLGSNE
ncbi:MAG: ABC transporter permease [Clostridiales bacterium]|nr:ABC transporter permease [Clostridiales bacterium]